MFALRLSCLYFLHIARRFEVAGLEKNVSSPYKIAQTAWIARGLWKWNRRNKSLGRRLYLGDLSSQSLNKEGLKLTWLAERHWHWEPRLSLGYLGGSVCGCTRPSTNDYPTKYSSTRLEN